MGTFAAFRKFFGRPQRRALMVGDAYAIYTLLLFMAPRNQHTSLNDCQSRMKWHLPAVSAFCIAHRAPARLSRTSCGNTSSYRIYIEVMRLEALEMLALCITAGAVLLQPRAYGSQH